MGTKTYILQVIFDIRQASERLNWQYFEEDENGGHKENKKHHKGDVHQTGTYSFQKDDLLKLEVVARGIDSKHKTKISILDCHIISRPILHFASPLNVEKKLAGTYPEPSPFSGSCVNSFENFEAWITRDLPWTDNNTVELQTTSTTSLTHVHDGRWQTSFVMTIQIELVGRAGAPAIRRVFAFDPECQVGTGVENLHN